jgi:thiol-disulfide isomerase/thioredoxin
MVLVALGVVSRFAPVLAQDNVKNDPSKQEQPALSLKVGDLAPALKVTTWLQGDAVVKFEPGKVYVVQFWASWCGAEIRHMPHLAALQSQYKEKGVTIIGFTCRDILGSPNNTAEEVAAFVKKRGSALKYTFAYADDRAMIDAWMKGQEHFPTFVVDKTGRIAYMGFPMFVDLVLPKVLTGDATAKAVSEEMAKADADYRSVIATFDRDPQAGLRALQEFEAKYPPLADFLPVVGAKLYLLLKQRNAGEGKEYAEALLAKAIKQNNIVVLELAYAHLRDQKENKELVALAVRAAEALVRINGGKDAWSLLRLADAYLVSGDKAKAKEHARKAIDAAAGESSAFQQEIEKEARRLGAETSAKDPPQPATKKSRVAPLSENGVCP